MDWSFLDNFISSHKTYFNKWSFVEMAKVEGWEQQNIVNLIELFKIF